MPRARAKTTGSDPFIGEFSRNPDERNWGLFRKRMLKDRAKYYYVVYPSSLKGKMSLREAYAVIYDGSYRQLYRIPIIKETSKGIEGATMYLKELDVNRKAI
ncbi:MAG: hypothetical protein KGI06_04395 [Candidatus Micrarchaeota archaeon]|nr:hypothetical protein [Candidatus Micrarchaeota archaeon]